MLAGGTQLWSYKCLPNDLAYYNDERGMTRYKVSLGNCDEACRPYVNAFIKKINKALENHVPYHFTDHAGPNGSVWY